VGQEWSQAERERKVRSGTLAGAAIALREGKSVFTKVSSN